MNLPPCDQQDHSFELLLRCTCCGFLIRLENTPHPISKVRNFLRRALMRLRVKRPDTGV